MVERQARVSPLRKTNAATNKRKEGAGTLKKLTGKGKSQRAVPPPPSDVEASTSGAIAVELAASAARLQSLLAEADEAVTDEEVNIIFF